MIRFRLFKLVACFLAGTFIVISLYAYTVLLRKNKNGFIRSLPSHTILGIISKDINYNSWYLSGEFNRTIYLGNVFAPTQVLTVDSALKTSSIKKISWVEEPLHKGTSLLMDGKSIYLADGVAPILLKGNTLDLNLNAKAKVPYFNSIVSLTEHSFVLRFINSKSENALAKLSKSISSFRVSNLLEKQVDGIFCTDGEIVKVPGSSKIIYVYYYRNQFLCTDSNLNLIYKGKTIDTISHAQIKVAKIVSTGETTMSAPPLYVNKRACANSKHLFVQSALRANNETEYMIKDMSTIDVYSIANGKYQFSFYLPDFRGFKVRDFKVYGKSLYALYDRYLYKYQLNF